MAKKKSEVIPDGQVNLFDLFGINSPAPVVETPPPSAPALPAKAAGLVLPDGWKEEDIRFLLNVLEEGPFLVADTELGVPTIHGNFGAEVEHCGFGLMEVKGMGYELSFDAGGAMQRTPSGNGWTRLFIEGKYAYDTKAVREKLQAFLTKEDAPQNTDLSPALPEEPQRDYYAEKRETALKFAEMHKRNQGLPQYMVAMAEVMKLPYTTDDESLIKVYRVGRDVELVTGEVVTVSGFFQSASGKYIETLQAGESMVSPGVELGLEQGRERCIHDSFVRGVLIDERQLDELSVDIPQLREMAKLWSTDKHQVGTLEGEPDKPNPFAIRGEDLQLIDLAKELKQAMGLLDDPSANTNMDALNALRPKVWSFINQTRVLEKLAESALDPDRMRIRDALADIEEAIGFDLTMCREWMKYVLLKMLLPKLLRGCIKLDTCDADVFALFENGYGLKLDLQLTAAGELARELVNIVVVCIKNEREKVRCENAPVTESSVSVADLPGVCEKLMGLKQAKMPVEEQVREFHRDLGQFIGTEKWTRYPALCPHIILLTDGALYVAEHGGEDGSSAYCLMDAIASYQGEAALKRHDFQVWKLVVHPPDEPGPAQNTVMAVLQSKPGRAPEKPFNPHRHTSLICTNGNEKELVRQEIEMTDFLPIGEIALYASIEEHPDISTMQKVMIILLSSEY